MRTNTTITLLGHQHVNKVVEYLHVVLLQLLDGCTPLPIHERQTLVKYAGCWQLTSSTGSKHLELDANVVPLLVVSLERENAGSDLLHNSAEVDVLLEFHDDIITHFYVVVKVGLNYIFFHLDFPNIGLHPLAVTVVFRSALAGQLPPLDLPRFLCWPYSMQLLCSSDGEE